MARAGVYEYYAATENNLVTGDRPDEALTRPVSVGKATVGAPHLFDDQGREPAAGQVGTIWSEGSREFDYHNDPARRRPCATSAAGAPLATSATSGVLQQQVQGDLT
jgi:hypothetical protein